MDKCQSCMIKMFSTLENTDHDTTEGSKDQPLVIDIEHDDDSSRVESDNGSSLCKNKASQRIASVDEGLCDKMKTHQKDAFEFIWKNCFSDCGHQSFNNRLGVG